MAFHGELEHLPIVDIVQLIHSTRKGGTLSVKGEKGESRIVFSEGHLVSANYLNGRVRIGRVLEKMGFITGEVLQESLEIQSKAGENRKPLLATLIEMGKVERKDATRALKKLVEMTVVELVGWTTGTFSLDTGPIYASEESSYLPEKMEQEIVLDAQMVLMDSLRIYDERERDGQSKDLLFTPEELAAEETPSGGELSGESPPEEDILTADELGLGDIDKLEKKIPDVFTGLRAADPGAVHRKVVNGAIEKISAVEKEKLVACLTELMQRSGKFRESPGRAARSILLFTRDDLMSHAVTAVSRESGAILFSTADKDDLGPIIENFLSKGIVPFLLYDDFSPPGYDIQGDGDDGLRLRNRKKYPQVPAVLLSTRLDGALFRRALDEGVRAVIPRPSPSVGEESFVAEFIGFLTTLGSYLASFFQEEEYQSVRALRGDVLALRELSDAPSLSLALLNRVGQAFPRAMVFIVGKGELIAERGVGIGAREGEEKIPDLNFRIPLTDNSAFGKAVKEGKPFFVEGEDEIFRDHLYGKIGSPLVNKVLLLPVRHRAGTIALVYGDFGEGEEKPVPIDMLAILAGEAGLILENALFRKQAGSRK